jgi:hypothetical protein
MLNELSEQADNHFDYPHGIAVAVSEEMREREEDIVGELVVQDGGIFACLSCPEIDERLE